jgi:hypothetical protein
MATKEVILAPCEILNNKFEVRWSCTVSIMPLGINTSGPSKIANSTQTPPVNSNYKKNTAR